MLCGLDLKIDDSIDPDWHVVFGDYFLLRDVDGGNSKVDFDQALDAWENPS
jgi:hypothetical protein